MRPEDYPVQEPFSAIGERYHAEVMRLGADVEGTDIALGDDAYQSVAVYRAEKPAGPVLCLIHGGGWTNGYKEWMAFMAPALTAQGITVVSFGYRLAPVHVYPAQFDDCAKAIAWTWRHIAEFGGDPEQIHVAGHSAGGHLSALLALRTDWQTAHDVPTNVIKSALPISGTYLFGEGSGLSMRPRFLGDPELGNEAPASPLTHIRADAPPFLIAFGSKDFPHLITQARNFAEKLAAMGVRTETLELEDCDHLEASYASGEPNGAWVRAAVAHVRNFEPKTTGKTG